MAPKCGSPTLQMWICPNSVPKFLIRCHIGQKVLCCRVAGESHENFFHQPVMCNYSGRHSLAFEESSLGFYRRCDASFLFFFKLTIKQACLRLHTVCAEQLCSLPASIENTHLVSSTGLPQVSYQF